MNNKEEFNQVRKVINSHDPVNLLAEGAPEDEYDQEVAEIIKLLKDDASIELSVKIHQIFVSNFGNEVIIDKNKYNQLASELKKIQII